MKKELYTQEELDTMLSLDVDSLCKRLHDHVIDYIVTRDVCAFKDAVSDSIRRYRRLLEEVTG